MNVVVCPKCGQIPTCRFDFTAGTVTVVQHVCMTAGGTPR